MAIDHRLVGEGPQKGDLALGEEPSLGATDGDRADREAFSHQGSVERGPEAELPRKRAAIWEFVDFGLQVGHVDDLPVDNRSARARPAPHREAHLAHRPNRNGTAMGDEAQPIAVQTEDGGIVRFAQSRRALRHGVEDGLDVRR
jgi:hypothetical protein